MTCDKWRPSNGVCMCGLKLNEHPPEVQLQVRLKGNSNRGTKSATATAISANAAARKPFLSFLGGSE